LEERPVVIPFALDVPGNFTIGGFLGVGTDKPERAVHLRGPNAVFRMDRSSNSAAFMLVRTDPQGGILKTYVVGVNASGPDDGEFIINDLGSAVGGGGARRLTIRNDGRVYFGGTVTAREFFQTSSSRFKTNIQPIEDSMTKLLQLRGVRFEWKETRTPAIGVIAEEVSRVLPEAVSWEGGEPVGVNYAGLVALLVEATKSQQTQLDGLALELNELEAAVRAELARLKEQSIADSASH